MGSIDAIITKVKRNDDGTATIALVPRPGADVGGQPGRFTMIVLNPPLSFEACVGTQVWGNANCLMVGQTKWAEREGYCRLRLVSQRKG